MKTYSLLFLLFSALCLVGCNNAHEIEVNNSGGSALGRAQQPQTTTAEPASQSSLELEHDKGTEMTTSAGGTVSSGGTPAQKASQTGSAANPKGAGIAGEQNAQSKNDVIPPAKDDETRPH